LIIPLFTWAIVEWRRPQDGLYSLVLAGSSKGQGARFLAALFVGCLLAGGPAYVLQALGLTLWAIALLFTGIFLAYVYGNQLSWNAAA
jgi:hypothetical protein